jgi:F-type H+-transporting ATPase subunit delta
MAAPSEKVRGYAQALLEIADAEGALDVVEDELFRFAKAVEQDSRLRDALTDIALPAERKRAVLEELLGEKANPHTVSLLAFVVGQGRARELGSIAEELVRLAAERRERAVAEVHAAVPLDEEQRTRLAAALSKATGKRIELKVLVDPSVLGGVVARIGDLVIDGSLRRKLELARERMSEV